MGKRQRLKNFALKKPGEEYKYKRYRMAKILQCSNNFAPKKCTTPEDLISQLPDEILVYILSSLSVKEAADTSFISKRWLNLWRSTPRLDFDATKPLIELARNSNLQKRQMKKYVRWVNCTLEACKVDRLEQFRVCFDLDKSAQHHIDKWLEFAFARQVQRLELHLLKGGKYTRYFGDCYTFPAQQLSLGDCARSSDIHKLPPLWNKFKSMTVLLLKSVNVTGEALEFFLHNCPFLEEMVVHGSGTLVNLEVVGPSLKLKHLEIWQCLNVKSLRICDVNLVTLGTSSGHKLLLSNVPMLIKVDIRGWPVRHILDEIFLWFSCVLSQLEVLKIHASNGLENFKRDKFPQLTKLNKFVLLVQAHEDMSLFGCTDIIEAAPQLKEFELQLIWFNPPNSKREYKKAVGCPHHHLKVLRLAGYHDRICVLELVRYLLENAIALEKIIVDPESQYICHDPLVPEYIEETKNARKEAKLLHKGEVPPHIEFVIL